MELSRRCQIGSSKNLDQIVMSLRPSEIAFRWGFNDLSHFSKTFRHHFGVPPRDYRSQ
ncbi:helix-turn-helix domain-containing protein [Agrobacterium vitis]|uniref:helix-turn-helix domain-containing protein n=1 Tax=Agrobacterium vitis TaxID=373 RepID=UPI003D26C13E